MKSFVKTYCETFPEKSKLHTQQPYDCRIQNIQNATIALKVSSYTREA